MWQDQIYFGYGLLFVEFMIVVVTSAELSITMTYFQLCSEVPSSSHHHSTTIITFAMPEPSPPTSPSHQQLSLGSSPSADSGFSGLPMVVEPLPHVRVSFDLHVFVLCFLLRLQTQRHQWNRWFLFLWVSSWVMHEVKVLVMVSSLITLQIYHHLLQCLFLVGGHCRFLRFSLVRQKDLQLCQSGVKEECC